VPPNIQEAPIKDTFYQPPAELLGHGARLPTAEELAQEKIFDSHQIELAIDKLKSVDVSERIAATETLNAYQLPKAEQQLGDVLLHDNNALVRQSAAQSLGLFKNLSDRTLGVLLKSLSDSDQKTCRESLNTLLSNTLRTSDNQDRFQKILGQLRKKANSRHVHHDIRLGLQAFLKDQEPIKSVFH
jgi:HEAT repeat protein